VLNELHNANTAAIAREKAALVAMVQNVEQRLEREAAAIRSVIASMEQQALLVDATAVPVIGLGIVLTSVPDLIARSTALSGLFIAAALICLELAWIHFWASGPAGQGEADHQAVTASLTNTTAG
jgi:hypothetical protein